MTPFFFLMYFYYLSKKRKKKKIRVVSINEKMQGSCLRWFGYVQRRAIKVLVRKSELIKV